MAARNWQKDIQPLIKKYKGKKFPLDYGNTYELVVMVILAAQDSDAHINKVAPELFKAFPNMKSLAKATEDTLHPLISKVRNFGNKTKWLMALAATVKDDKNIPMTMDELTELPGIGRKSANVIMRESGAEAEGIIVDLHVVRVAPRLGIATGTDPKKIEKTNDGGDRSKRLGRSWYGDFLSWPRDLPAYKSQTLRVCDEKCLCLLQVVEGLAPQLFTSNFRSFGKFFNASSQILLRP